MQEVVNKLQGDWDFVAYFLQNPDSAIAAFNLNEEEKRTITSRTAESLVKLGFKKGLALGAASGAHSQQCGK